MKKIFNFTMIKTLVCAVIVSIATMSCNEDDFFLLPDRGGIDAAIWDSPGSVQMHLNRTYDLIIPQFIFEQVPDRWGIHYASDENFYPHADQWSRRALGMDAGYQLGNHDVRYTGNAYVPNRIANRYIDIAMCNAAIKFIPLGAMEQTQKDLFLGQYYAMRAMVYLEQAKVYGGVPLILEPIDPENIEVDGRNSAREIFDAVLADLDQAIVLLENANWEDKNGRGKIDKVIATCLKAKVLLYWASPQFNPLDDPKHPHDASRWQTAFEAYKAAYDLCKAQGKTLLANYADIFRVEGTQNTEAILVRTYANNVPQRGQNIENRVRPASGNGSAHQAFTATVKLLNTYTMKDGNPIGQSTYQYNDILFWQNRDPRFEATIAYNGSSWALNGDNNRRQWTYGGAETDGRGVYCKRYSTASLSGPSAVNYTSGIGGNGMDWIELRLAEVMLDYAECANETGNLALAKEMVREIRKRAKIEEGTAGNDYGLGRIVGKDAMRDLLMDERMIEFAFENKRNSDLRRTRRMHLLTGSMETIQIAVKPGLSGDPNVTTQQWLAQVVEGGRQRRDGININIESEYLTYFDRWTVNLGNQNYLPYNVPVHHYFYTFHNDFVYKGKNIEPTIGWAGGTFDPLDN